jgi:cyclophilin family peptidyl-prolyl cis-trans isomerase
MDLGILNNSLKFSYQTTMKNNWLIISFLLIAAAPVACHAKVVKYPVVEIITSEGNIYIWLYDDTPLHKENFLKLIKDGFYDKTKFHRIIKDFMIQGGDPNTKDISLKDQWGQGGPGYTIDAEIKQEHYHKKGVIAAARMGDQTNPKRSSSGSQFYIVQGTKYNAQSLDLIEKQIRSSSQNLNFRFTDEMRKSYEEIGGAPHLDMQYTVFGEVISGLDIVDKIAMVQTGMSDKPVQDVEMDINVLEMSAKQIKKKFDFVVPGTNRK